MGIERIGRYEILETLGRGAMGVVYLARDPIIDREVALKTLRVDLDTELADEFRERFMREARAAGRLNHRCIVTVHDVGEDQETGLVFIAMEYIRGRNLKDLLASGHRFRPSESARIAAELANALDYAHATGVVHRDVKPANIILTEDGSPKITDFGVARLESSNLTVEGQFIGTPNYMSPEQVTGAAIDGRSDLFSLGVVLFELLTGRKPFTGPSMHEVTRKIVQEAPPIPSTLDSSLPPAFNPIVLKCLEKDAGRRFQSGGDLAKVLAALARSLVHREPSDAERTGVVSPDIPTRVTSDTSATTRPPVAKPGDRGNLIQRLPLPQFMHWQVHPTWVARIVAVWAAVWLVFAAVLSVKRDSGPFVAPSAGSARNLHTVARNLHEGSRWLDKGNPVAAERLVLEVLDQAPSSPAARRVIGEARRQLREERSSVETQDRVAAMVSEGRQLYSRGRYQDAAERFEDALSLDPESELARSYLELTDDRQRAAPQAQNTTPTRRRSAGPTTSRRAPVARAQPTPGVARITVFFDSPVSIGTVVVTLDAQTLAEIPFNFTQKRLLGIKRKGSGQVKRVILAPSGRHTVGVELNESDRGSLGSETFTENLPAGSNWTLRINLAPKATAATFFLVQAR